jgi:hypothetical protein
VCGRDVVCFLRENAARCVVSWQLKTSEGENGCDLSRLG